MRSEIASKIPGKSGWDEKLLAVESPTFVTVRATRSTVVHDNAKVHDWARALVTRLERIAADHPIDSLTITAAGPSA